MSLLAVPLLASALTAAVDAPITQVTVFTDQARVVRTAQVQVNGTLSLELPPLRDTIDPASVRVEALGAEVRRVELERLEPEKLRTDEAKALLAELEKFDTDRRRVAGERQALLNEKAALESLRPEVPAGTANTPPPKLSSAGWAASAQFSADALTAAQRRLRELELQAKKLDERRAQLLIKANELGQPQTASGWKLVARLAGNGPATVTCTYLVGRARWSPSWDLQLLPDSNMVNLSLAGLVSQESGEDWTQAALTLSTAIPSAAVKAPRLSTWKIGIVDRFIPTPSPVVEQIAPPPPAPQAPALRTEEDLLRGQLREVAGLAAPALESGLGAVGRGDYGQGSAAFGTLGGKRQAAPPRPRPSAPAPPPSAQPSRPGGYAPSAPAAAPMPMEEKAGVDFDGEEVEGELARPEATVSVSSDSRRRQREEAPIARMSLSPPPAWRPPSYGADSPVTLAGGYDLAFTSLQKESVPASKGTRRVALWSQKWPVTVERKLFPALSPDAFLVAELKNPSQAVLPGGGAQLYVGADPAGTARLKLVSPGEAFTLPLGIDRALKAVRNVKVVDATEGVLSKDDVTTYQVSIEIANPYKAPVALRVYDQWPVTNQKDLEVKLLESKPLATQDQLKGSLEWRLTIPPQQKATLSFSYSLKRPHGWKLSQQEVQP